MHYHRRKVEDVTNISIIPKKWHWNALNLEHTNITYCEPVRRGVPGMIGYRTWPYGVQQY